MWSGKPNVFGLPEESQTDSHLVWVRGTETRKDKADITYLVPNLLQSVGDVGTQHLTGLAPNTFVFCTLQLISFLQTEQEKQTEVNCLRKKLAMSFMLHITSLFLVGCRF